MRMKIYDISQEVFGCAVYPGDPKPERKIVLKMSEGAVCNLSAFSMCAHNGTHVDAPLHFPGTGFDTEKNPSASGLIHQPVVLLVEQADS